MIIEHYRFEMCTGVVLFSLNGWVLGWGTRGTSENLMTLQQYLCSILMLALICQLLHFLRDLNSFLKF